MDKLRKRKTDNKSKKNAGEVQKKDVFPDDNHPTHPGISVEEDIIGTNSVDSAVKPDILREDHPGLAK
ncbi:hypothetical protein RYH73_06770 [Olivibacter sp. CPCC 100613]|uniref:hypothetical protein n=1 Tax=Olivibacter sp. CPCC 100613 TaxID=3079931 RepID=UPI002FFB221A